MDEYISREATVKAFCEKCKGYYDGHCVHRGECDIDVIQTAPAADVQPVKHGKWEETHISLVKYIPEDEKEEGHSFYMAELKCSCCKRYNAVTFALTLNKPDFCQLCGARMIKDGDTNE